MKNITCPICDANANLVAECDTCLGTGTLDRVYAQSITDKVALIREDVYRGDISLHEVLRRLEQVYAMTHPVGALMHACLVQYSEELEDLRRMCEVLDSATAKVARAICG